MLAGALEAARVVGVVGPAGATGLARPAVVQLDGPDAGRFLHGQVTNDVEGLEIGSGNVSARVSRTGHLQAVFSVHRVGERTFWLVCAEEDAATVAEQLEAFHFADELTISVLDDDVGWAMAHGPLVADLLDVGSSEGDVVVEAGGAVFVRSLTGDPGVLLRGSEDWIAGWTARAVGAGCLSIDGSVMDGVIEVLRVEAGWPRTATELTRKPAAAGHRPGAAGRQLQQGLLHRPGSHRARTHVWSRTVGAARAGVRGRGGRRPSG